MLLVVVNALQHQRFQRDGEIMGRILPVSVVNALQHQRFQRRNSSNSGQKAACGQRLTASEVSAQVAERILLAERIVVNALQHQRFQRLGL